MRRLNIILVNLQVLCTLICAAPAVGQTAGQTKAPASGPTNFNIETEMLTYRALQSNSEAVACDIAGFLHGVKPNFSNLAKGTVCDVKTGTHAVTVILMPMDNSQFADFQIWRADMTTMDRLQRSAQSECPSSGAGKGGLPARGPAAGATNSGAGGTTPAAAAATSAATSAAQMLLSLSPATGPLAMAQSAFALMATQESVASVVGTVQDQAFMDSVARQLRVFDIQVLMPTSFSPGAITPLDPQFSPFLASLDRTIAARECLAAIDPGDDKVRALSLQRKQADIDLFLSVLTGANVSFASSPDTTPSNAQKPDTGGSQNQASQNQASQKQNTTAKTTPAATNHLNAVLAADGLAQKLGVARQTGQLADTLSKYILVVKALESGGAVSHHTNILGTSVRYSGGAVGTYALFRMDGQLECSGNVFDYAGGIKAKEFRDYLNDFRPSPGKQMIFIRDGCSTSASH